MSVPMRPILPKHETVDTCPPTDVVAKRKRSKLLKCACNTCRTRKTACDGIRPSCGWCTTHDLVCQYVTQDKFETSSMALKRENEYLRGKVQELELFLVTLSRSQGNLALGMLSMLKVTSDLSKTIEECSTILQKQNASTGTAMKESKLILDTTVELRLVAQHSSAYPSRDIDENEMFKKLTMLDSHFWAHKRSIHDCHSLNAASTKSLETSAINDKCTSDSYMLHGRPAPPETSHIADRNVWIIKEEISRWTEVDIDARYMLDAISSYLQIDHPILGVLDAELFLDSFFGLKEDFCCPLLINGLLAYTSQTHVRSNSNETSLQSLFTDAAVKALKEPGAKDSLTRICGLVHLSLAHTSQGEAEPGTKYLQQATIMAERMHLFGDTRKTWPTSNTVADENLIRMRAHVAWGTFNQVYMHGLFHIVEPAGQPPLCPIPASGANICRTAHFVDETYTFILGSSSTFGSFCNLWSLVSEIMTIRRTSQRPTAAPIAFALEKFDQLLAIADNLPEDLSRTGNVPADVLTFHIWFHAVILDLFRPHVWDNDEASQRDPTISEVLTTDIYAASMNQLKRLLVVYMHSVQYARQSMWWNIAPLCVANDVLKNTTDTDWRAYFMLCLHGYSLLLQFFKVAKSVIQGLLALAVETGAIDAVEAISLAEQLTPQRNPEDEGRHSSAYFVLDLSRAVVDPSSAIVDELATRFQDIRIFHEFTWNDLPKEDLIDLEITRLG